jgi:hypothetical protein
MADGAGDDSGRPAGFPLYQVGRRPPEDLGQALGGLDVDRGIPTVPSISVHQFHLGRIPAAAAVHSDFWRFAGI